jgi:PAS domain S-box-containing protein
VTESDPRTSTFWSGEARLLVNFASRSVFVDDDEIHFTPTEFDVLACLARRAGTVVTTSELVDVVWGEWYGPMDHVFVHVHHIRRKLGPCGRLIVTKRKAGYLLRRELIDGSDAGVSPSIQVEYLDMLQQDAQGRGIVWLIVDSRRHVTWVSDSVFSLLGWTPQELVGRFPWSLAHRDESEGFEARFPLIGGDSLLSFDTRLNHADGSVVHLHIAAQVLRGADGDVIGGLGEWSGVAGSGTEPPG